MSKKSLKKFYPWLVWVLAASFFYYKYLIQVSPGVMTYQLMNEWSLTGTSLGHLAACFFYGYMLMQIPAGILLDRWSPGKITSIATFICAGSVFLFAHSNSLATAGMSRFLIGLSASFAAISCFKLTSIWFPPKRFAFMAGLSMTAAMVGAIGGEGPLALLIGKVGWRQALELIALSGFALSFLIWFLIQDRETAASDRYTIRPDKTGLFVKLKIITGNKQTWLLSLYSGLAFSPVSVFGGLWGVDFIQKAYALSVSDAALAVSFIFMGFALGCPLAGWISDYLGRRKPIMVSGTILALFSISSVLYLPLSQSFLLLCLGLFGFGASGFFLCFSMVREIHPFIFTGTVLGFMNTFDSACEAITEPFIGWLLDLSWSGTEEGTRVFSIVDYHFSLLVLPMYLVFAIVLSFFIKETYCKQKINETIHTG